MTVATAGQELFDMVEDDFAAVDPIGVVDAGKLDQLRASRYCFAM